MQTRSHSKLLRVFALITVLTTGFFGGTLTPVNAQKHHTRVHHSFLHRHRNAASAVAGVGAYKYARSRHHGFMHRHPYLTGAAAAVVTHHYAKKHK